MNQKGTIHFTIGEGFGRQLMQIAQEHLLFDLNPTKALDTITGSLIGMPTELALEILSGEVVVETVDEGTVNTRPRKETDFTYPLLDAVEWYKKEFRSIGDSGREFYKLLEDCLRGIVNHDGTIDLEVNYTTLLKYFSSDDPKELLETIKQQTNYEYLVYLIRASTNYLKRTYEVWEVMKFLEESYPDTVNCRNGCALGKHDVVSIVAIKLNMLTNLNIDFLKERYAEIDAPLLNHIKAEVAIKEELQKEIQPLSFAEKRHSGWVSPEGEWFGLDGEISNLLHCTLASMIHKRILLKTGIDIGKSNPDRWLESNGWVKLTDNWVLYDGYTCFGSRKRTSMTSEQKEFIKDYCNANYKGVVCVGYMKEAIPAVRLTFIDDFAVEKYFRL